MGWIRKTAFALCVLVFTGFGLLLGSKDGANWHGVVGMGILWLAVGTILGIFLSTLGLKEEAPALWRRRRRVRARHDELSDEEMFEMHEDLQKKARLGGQGMSPEERFANYWRDRDNPPSMTPEDFDYRNRD